MFEDSLIDSAGRLKGSRWTTLLSFLVQAFVVCVLILIPLLYTQALPGRQLMTFVTLPPPPPPAPAPPRSDRARLVATQSEMIQEGGVRMPTRIPDKVQMITETEAPLPVSSVGIIGAAPGSAAAGDTIGSIMNSTRAAVPRPAIPARVRVSQGVQEGLLTHQVKPEYPPLARQARIQGSVILQAVIARDGTIQNLRVISGPPMLAPAAIEAVRQWRYRPYILNGDPVEVETQITVNFTLSGG